MSFWRWRIAQKSRGLPKRTPVADKEETQGDLGLHPYPAFSLSLDQVTLLLDEQHATISSLASLLRSYGRAKALHHGQRLHTVLHARRLDQDPFLGFCLVEMYGSCGSIPYAQLAFDRMPNPSVYSWNLLIKTLGKGGVLAEVKRAFDRTPERDRVTWNTLIAALAQNGHGIEALNIYHRMKREGFCPDRITFVSALDACVIACDVLEGQDIHVALVVTGYDHYVTVGTALLNMYGKGTRLQEARRVFDLLPDRDVICWNAMISVFVQNGDPDKALSLCKTDELKGVKFNKVSYISYVEACPNLEILEEEHLLASPTDRNFDAAKAARASGILQNPTHGRLAQSSQKTKMSVLSENILAKEALHLYSLMPGEGVNPDLVTFTGVLDACASLAALEEGQAVHASIVLRSCEQEIVVGNSLISMYGECGSLFEARKVFDKMCDRSLVSWTAMITSYVLHGCSEDALHLFQSMLSHEVEPDDVTFVCVLSACGRAGWIDEGKYFFVCMTKLHNIPHSGDHYVCMIDLLGRSGMLDEAEHLIENVPLEKVGMAWRCILAACSVHGDEERGLRAARKCFVFDPENESSYVMLANICAAGRLGSG